MASYVTRYEYADTYDDVDPQTVSDLQIATASAAVDRALRTATYTVDATGTPTDPAVLAAVKLATIVQIKAELDAAQARTAATANPLGRPLSSASIDGVSYTADAPSADSLALPPDGSLCAAALLHLERIPRTVWVHG